MVDRLPAEPSFPLVPGTEAIAPMEAAVLLVAVTGISHAWLLQEALQERGVDSRLGEAPGPPLILWIPATIRAARRPLIDIYVRPEDLGLARQIYADFEASAEPGSRPSPPPKPRPRRPRRRRW